MLAPRNQQDFNAWLRALALTRAALRPDDPLAETPEPHHVTILMLDCAGHVMLPSAWKRKENRE
jgi:hypothetical protein